MQKTINCKIAEHGDVHAPLSDEKVFTPKEIVAPLLRWYDKNKRTLPWRDQNNAYYTWISEIMLQQTRVEAVKPYFLRFITSLPDVKALAECPEDHLLKLWEGLGYYNRVRNMQIAAKTVMEHFDGKLPASYEELCSLKGIGSYTAGAIASIAYGIPVPAVDGNVLRVMTRVTENRGDITKQSVRKEIEHSIHSIIPRDCPGDFNQALMELGALICLPNGPAKCEDCPLAFCCKAYEDSEVEELPVKTTKKPRKMENRTVLVIQDGDYTAIRKRPSKGLLAGLYELPNVEGHLSTDEAVRLLEDKGLEPLYIEALEPAKHIFSHVEWRMIGYRIRVSSLREPQVPGTIFVQKKESEEQYAIPSAFHAYVKYMKEEK